MTSCGSESAPGVNFSGAEYACRTPRVGKLGSWQVAGTQSALDTIHASGAKNVASQDSTSRITFPRWLKYAPKDSARAIWTKEFGAIQDAGYPVVVDEFGEFDCGHEKIDRLMDWADG
jgi:hypothetical protein